MDQVKKVIYRVFLADITFLFLFNYLLTKSLVFSIVTSIVIYVGIYAFRSYDLEYMRSVNEQIIRNSIGTVISFFLLAIFYVLFPAMRAPKEIYLYNLVFTTSVITFIHTLSYKIIQKTLPVKEYIVIGKDNELKSLMKEIENKSLGKIKVKEYVNPTTEKLKETIKKADGVLIADPELEKEVSSYIKLLQENGYEVTYLPNLAEDYLKRIPLTVLRKFKEYYEVAFENVKESPAKRILDIVISVIGLIIFSPVVAVISLFIILEDGFPVVFKQERIGKNGRKFVLYKLRSMRKVKEGSTGKFATDEEHRILKIGQFMRKFRLDEVLQFINVLKGDMSVIGPRPEQKELAERFEELIPEYSFRHALKPGITGWAQLKYKYASNLEETKIKLSYDLWYIKNRNIFLDFKIILQTIEAILFRRGAK